MTLGELRATRASDVVGICSDKPAFLALVNEATSRLMTRGGFWGTVAKLQTCVRCNSITWPRAVDTVLAVNLCGRQMTASGYWWSFLPMSGADYRCCMSRCGYLVIQSDGQVPVQAQLECGKERYIRAFPAYQADVGKSVTLFGIDSNGQEIFTKRADGSYQLGVVLTLAIPFVGTPFLVRRITRVIKDATMGPVRLFAYDATNDVMEDCAIFAPSERSPSFAHSTIKGCRRGNSCNGLTAVEALVKLRFIPVETDDDEVLISNWVALKMMMLAIRAEDAGDTDESLKLQAKAVHELNLELRSHIPEDQVPISIDVFGSATPRSIGVGLIV